MQICGGVLCPHRLEQRGHFADKREGIKHVSSGHYLYAFLHTDPMSVSRKASRKWIRYFQQFFNFVPPKTFSNTFIIMMIRFQEELSDRYFSNKKSSWKRIDIFVWRVAPVCLARNLQKGWLEDFQLMDFNKFL